MYCAGTVVLGSHLWWWSFFFLLSLLLLPPKTVVWSFVAFVFIAGIKKCSTERREHFEKKFFFFQNFDIYSSLHAEDLYFHISFVLYICCFIIVSCLREMKCSKANVNQGY